MTSLPHRGTSPAAESLALLALWAAGGVAAVVSVAGLLSIGLFVAPLAALLLVTAVVLTARRPGSWPAVAGLGFALSAALGALGATLGSAAPSSGSCSATSDGVVTCTSGGAALDPDAFAWARAAPCFVAAVVVAVLTAAGYLVLRRLTTGWVRSP
ncbi:hypothetical protein Q9R29_07540 [Rothia sp. ARF10]|nr:hypothetical protein [Rothia sp. ARF10]